MNRFLKDESGVLTFEWILLITVLVIGIVGGLSAVRDAMIDELGDVCEAMVSVDQSFYICWPWEVTVGADLANVWDGGAASRYLDNSRAVQYGRPSGTPDGDVSTDDLGHKYRQNFSQVLNGGAIGIQ